MERAIKKKMATRRLSCPEQVEEFQTLVKGRFFTNKSDDKKPGRSVKAGKEVKLHNLF